ncbi:MAG: hypothetical protein WDM89_14440 [Rhizomicrobium sp.]
MPAAVAMTRTWVTPFSAICSAQIFSASMVRAIAASDSRPAAATPSARRTIREKESTIRNSPCGVGRAISSLQLLLPRSTTARSGAKSLPDRAFSYLRRCRDKPVPLEMFHREPIKRHGGVQDIYSAQFNFLRLFGTIVLANGIAAAKPSRTDDRAPNRLTGCLKPGTDRLDPASGLV